MSASPLAELSAQLVAGGDLLPRQVALAADALAATVETDETKAAFLTALAVKGETAAEVAAFCESSFGPRRRS